MKLRMCVAAFALLAMLGTPSQAALLSLSPTTSSGAVGTRLTYNVEVGRLAAGQALAAFDLDLLFNPAVLAPAEVNFGAALGAVDVDQFTSVAFGAGRIDFAAVSLLDGPALLALQGGAFTLAQIVFEALAPGSTPISFDELTPPGLLLGDAVGDAIDVEGFANGAALVLGDGTPVPEPAIALLMLAALPGLWRVRQRSR